MRKRLSMKTAVRIASYVILGALVVSNFSCSSRPDPNTLVMIIESSPTNLDPRVGTDGQSERISELIFDALLRRDEHFNVQPGLAERWEAPDSLSYVFHLRHGVRFHDGRPLTARDVKWTFDSLLQSKIPSTKAATYKYVASVEALDDFTVIFHLKEPFATLPWNVSEGAIGIVPYGSGSELSAKPIGSGPFRFVSAAQDQDVVVARNDEYWGGKPKLASVRFLVVPDETTRVLELRKGSADVASNAFSPDVATVLGEDRNLEILRAPGTIYAYLAFNLRDPILQDVRVRQAIAYAIDRRPLIESLWCNQVRPADSILPPQSWAYSSNVPHYEHDLVKAAQLLDAAGYPLRNGVRFPLTMKTSTDGTTRLMAAILQQQLAESGIALEIRSFESATFLADVAKGAFQFYSLRWIGGNQDPDMFEAAFHSSKFPPNGSNRGHYANPRVDALIDQGRRTLDQERRKAIYAELQTILATDLPYVHLWYIDNVVVHTRRVRGLTLNPSGNYDFLRTAELAP
jgi:peptide/nickel transport system substrate-binding protein